MIAKHAEYRFFSTAAIIMEASQNQQPLPSQQTPLQSPQQPHPLTTEIPPLHHFLSRTANSTPISSPGLFSPSNPRPGMGLPTGSASDATTPAGGVLNSPFLHPLQTHRVRETNKALVDLDLMTGRKLINQYEVIEEIGRGVHGKVKLARSLETNENVAIKIVPRFSTRRRLGKVMALTHQDKSKKEIAILKKIRHPNVVALLEIIDDPELKKIYMVLEHVELGEVVWRKKGIPWVCAFERRRIEKEMRGEASTEEEEQYLQIMERRNAIKELKRAKMLQKQRGPEDFWSIEYGAANDEGPSSLPRALSKDDKAMLLQLAELSRSPSHHESRATSRAPSRAASSKNLSRAATPQLSESDIASLEAEFADDLETPGPEELIRSQPGSSTALDTAVFAQDAMFRGRSPSMADSIISHMSSVDFNPQAHDPFADDYSYVPCFTIEEARATFRDTVLGLEYLHYEGIVHRDIKPANLLWTKEHRVKIADFGVSYFGRPIRDGDMDDVVSESEARDFDDDLELAKTVGTPAFFAPELCYTDLDGSQQPKISEQIDVWSLGVTLYCLIFARIPFMAEDEFQMFHKIAKEDVHIPWRRLKPVDPQTNPASTSLYGRINNAPYRDDNELVYEEIDDLLHHLLSRMLEKNPERRIRLREVKRHPWVVQGIPEPLVAWLDDTDPSRRSAGRKIQVDHNDITRAVIPLNFLERARSAVKKAVGKVMPHRPAERADSQNRKRATSSAASSAGDSIATASSHPNLRDIRRRSLKGDDYSVTSGHPLTQSVTASPQGSPLESGIAESNSVGGNFSGRTSRSGVDFNAKSEPPSRPPSTPSTSSSKPFAQTQGHLRIRSMNNTFLSLTPDPPASQTMPSTPTSDPNAQDDPIAALRKSRDMKSLEDVRCRSVDRGLFASPDKRAEAKVSLSTAVAPGNVELPRRPTPLRASNTTTNNEAAPLPSPMLFSPQAIRNYQYNDLRATSDLQDILDSQQSTSAAGSRPWTPQDVMQMEGKTPPPRVYNSSTPESFARAQAQNLRRQQLEAEEQSNKLRLAESSEPLDPAHIPCPPSPDDELPVGKPLPPTRSDTLVTVITADSMPITNDNEATTPLTSPSDVMSPVGGTSQGGATEAMQIFRSDPSLPALLSGASSVSADAEGEFLLQPGSIEQSSLIDTTDSLTPPALGKEPITGFHLEEMDHEDSAVQLHLSRALHGASPSSAYSSRAIEDDDDSDSDEGIVMAKSKRKPPKDHFSQQLGRIGTTARRRDTQTSVGSTETAKKIVVHTE
ncbi:hypothetical protein BX600DRAFT_506787 [Xylariales sp. PMI_506]|nr:hypothetical protein BX600DRAFT_506787 [Xylariales sp. PMI_506]